MTPDPELLYGLDTPPFKFPNKPESTASPEQTMALISKHLAEIRNLVRVSYDNLTAGSTGMLGDVEYLVERRLGKQQPVLLLKLTFPDNQQAEVVVRPTSKKFAEYQAAFPAIEKYFPKLYASFPGAYGTQILLLEKVHGLEENTDAQAWMDFAGHPDSYQTLHTRFFEIVDEILQHPLTLHDLQPMYGHNVFFNAETKKLQLFDVDTLADSSESHDWKYVQLIAEMVSSNVFEAQSNFRLAFYFMLLKHYLDKYPDALFEKYGQPRKLHKMVYLDASKPVERQEEYFRVVRPGEDGYDELFGQYMRGGARTWRVINKEKPLPILGEQRGMFQEKRSLRPEILAAVKADDFVAFRRALQESIRIIQDTEIKAE